MKFLKMVQFMEAVEESVLRSSVPCLQLNVNDLSTANDLGLMTSSQLSMQSICSEDFQSQSFFDNSQPVIDDPPPSNSSDPVFNSDPVTSSDPPVTSSDPPVTSSDPPVTSSDPPVTSSDPPVISSEQPARPTPTSLPTPRPRHPMVDPSRK